MVRDAHDTLARALLVIRAISRKHGPNGSLNVEQTQLIGKLADALHNVPLYLSLGKGNETQNAVQEAKIILRQLENKELVSI